jgi:hypothetical protein
MSKRSTQFLVSSFFFSFFSILSYNTVAQDNTWKLFSDVKFVKKYYPDVDTELLTPVFDTRIKSYQGKDVTIKGYVIPLHPESPFLILSKFPYAQCFFCGGAGPESVVAVYIQNQKMPNENFKIDQMVEVKGKLYLNDSDLDQLNFILKNSSILSK